jgi:hypothetical protein
MRYFCAHMVRDCTNQVCAGFRADHMGQRGVELIATDGLVSRRRWRVGSPTCPCSWISYIARNVMATVRPRDKVMWEPSGPTTWPSERSGSSASISARMRAFTTRKSAGDLRNVRRRVEPMEKLSP